MNDDDLKSLLLHLESVLKYCYGEQFVVVFLRIKVKHFTLHPVLSCLFLLGGSEIFLDKLTSTAFVQVIDKGKISF